MCALSLGVGKLPDLQRLTKFASTYIYIYIYIYICNPSRGFLVAGGHLNISRWPWHSSLSFHLMYIYKTSCRSHNMLKTILPATGNSIFGLKSCILTCLSTDCKYSLVGLQLKKQPKLRWRKILEKMNNILNMMQICLFSLLRKLFTKVCIYPTILAQTVCDTRLIF